MGVAFELNASVSYIGGGNQPILCLDVLSSVGSVYMLVVFCVEPLLADLERKCVFALDTVEALLPMPTTAH